MATIQRAKTPEAPLRAFICHVPTVRPHGDFSGRAQAPDVR
ncbi:hypothetical protein MXAN_4248 [Myxococcus xanthus DK 1622]|uniref:Uncharacterized protein n=1 Tax=Myxococcus xanthus (strain DK1622) TaxID=246197 RepID=Q1D4K0_MYXXD|nr:hypothetical protein MXAN_4248 [Myxococcus xanthus DK 1622]